MGLFYGFGGAPGKPLPPLDLYPNRRRPTRNKDGVRPTRKNHFALIGLIVGNTP